MKKALFLFLFLWAGNGYGEEMRAQFRTWKSSEIQCGDYTNVLISSTPIIFHMVTGSGTVNVGGTSQFAFHRSSAFPFMANIVSTKAFIPLDVSHNMLGKEWNVVTSTSYGFNDYSYFSKVGGACPIMYLWDYYFMPPIQTSNRYFPKD